MTTTTMNPEIKTAWTGRLRSGEIQQGCSYLGMGDARCCLGVLCDLAAAAETIEASQGRYDPEQNWTNPLLWDYGQVDDEETLPQAVQDWAGLNESNPLVQVPDEFIPQLTDSARRLLGLGGVTNGITLAQLNDSGVPFGLIADIIDATL